MKIQAWVLTLVIAACLSQQDLRDAECGVGCRREGYSTGKFVTTLSKCSCDDLFNYESITGKKLTLPKRVGTPPVVDKDRDRSYPHSYDSSFLDD